MAELLQAIALYAVLALLPIVLLAALVGAVWKWRPLLWVSRRVHRRQPPPALVMRRPLEEIAYDARRISARYHQPGMRFAQYEGRRQAFDRVLGEAADALEIENLLGVLAPGLERDTERERVEARLVEAGLLLRDPAEPA